MTMQLHFLPEIEEDVMAGYIWYEDKAVGLGEEFLRIFYAAAMEIRSTPRLFPVVNRDVRRCLIRRFPYAIYFKCESEVITVIGLFHCARNPGIIQDSIEGRTGLEKDS